MPRLPALALLALASGGCTTLLGIDEPATEHEVNPRMSMRFVMGFDAEGLAVYRFLGDLEVIDAAARRVTLTMSPLPRVGDQPLGEERVEELDLALDNAATFDFTMDDVPLTLPPAATADGVEVFLVADFTAEFPILEATGEATIDGFCGTADGTVSRPNKGPLTASFAAVRLETSAPPPPVEDVRTDCADL